jgi:outer membrane receptor for Fe3+-dicitrate
VAAVEETITVSSETPVVDTKKTGTATTLTREELEGVPNSRDPWAVLRTIPGVLVDRHEHRGLRERPAVLVRGQGRGPDRHPVGPSTGW